MLNGQSVGVFVVFKWLNVVNIHRLISQSLHK